MRKVLFVILLCLLALFCVSMCYYNRWKSLWALNAPKPLYTIEHSHDDTLRIVMIGDSWAGMRTKSLNEDFQLQLSEMLGYPVILKTKGKGGEITKGIYQLLFESGKYGTRPLIINGVNYCVIFAGINDAAANLGTQQYCHYYSQIIDFLLYNHIRPVIVEIPNVDIWHVYRDKPLKDCTADFLRAVMTGCKMYNYKEYRMALIEMLKTQQLMEKVLFVRMEDWNGLNPEIEDSIFLSDRIHLNCCGYEKLDEAIMRAIATDLK